MSRLPLTERLGKPMKQPKELAAWSEVGGRVFDDDRALRYYYFPPGELDKRLNLAVGSSTFKASPPDEKYLDPVLHAVEKYEREHGRLDVSLITWRGLITKIVATSQPGMGDSDGFVFNVVGFDGQVFISSDRDADVARFNKSAFPNRDKFMYCGYNFERYATLAKPWGESTRDDVEQRYRGAYKPGSEYGILVRGGVGPIKAAYGAEVDCVEGRKDPNAPTAHYVEMKSTGAIRNPRNAELFEKKLFNTWLQSFLVGVPKIVYGFRDPNFDLVAVEEFQTTKLPTLVKNSRVTPPPKRWNGNDAIAFYAVFLSWIRDTVKDGHTYQLRYDGRSNYLELVEHSVKVSGRQVAFISNEFVQWRREQSTEKQ